MEQIRELIATGERTPGEPFATESELEAKLQVSRPIIREAVSRLRALGILDSRQSVGLIIAKPDPVALFEKAFVSSVMGFVDLEELAELRYSLELGSVELACRRGTPEQWDRLLALAEEFARNLNSPNPTRSLDETELEFHGTILKATHNAMLTRMHHIIGAYFQRGAREISGWSAYRSDAKSAWEHQSIAEAFMDRNVERARVYLSGHLARLLRDSDGDKT